MVHVILVNASVMHLSWNEHNNSTPNRNTFETISTTFTWTVISNAPKNVKTAKNYKKASYIALWNLILTSKKTLKDRFYLEMVSHGAINDLIHTL